MHIDIVEELIACRCLDSAVELWKCKIQFVYLESKAMRSRSSPYDVSTGLMTVPYGLEYYGGRNSRYQLSTYRNHIYASIRFKFRIYSYSGRPKV